MKEIENDEFFSLDSENRKKGVKLVLSILRRRSECRKSFVVEQLNQEEVYHNKKDCKDFLKNLVRSKNVNVQSKSRSKVELNHQSRVTAV